MQVTINLSADDVRISKSIVRNQTHFVLNSETVEDAVITKILQLVSRRQLSEDKVEKELETFASLVSKKLWGEKE